MRYVLFVLIASLSLPSVAQVSSEFKLQWKRDFPNARWAKIKPAPTPRKLLNNPITGLNDKKFEALANFQMDRLGASALVIAKGNNIVYQSYPDGEPRSNFPRLGFSMSKSVTAITLGVAHCRGDINSLDEAAAIYLKDLESTSWGRATIRQILAMSSGSAQQTDIYTGNVSESARKRLRGVYWGEHSDSFAKVMEKYDENAHPPGTTFKYNNFDTLALSMIVENASGKPFYRFFEDHVAPIIGLENKSKWLTNTYGQTSSYQGFSATPLDWIRVGRFTLETLTDTSETAFNKCLTNYMGEMTSLQIDADDKLDGGYGFQTWVNCGNSADFCFIGWGGQYLLFNVEKDLIMYMSSRSEKPTGWATREFFDSIVSRLQ